MKVLQINTFYKYGSTGKIVADIHTELQRVGEESVVCYGRREMPAEPHVYKVSAEWEGKIHAVFSRLFGVDFGHSRLATRRLLHILEAERPDVVHLHCLNGHFVHVYRLVTYLKEHKIPTVLTLHAEIMHTAGCEHAMECEKWKTQCHSCVRIKGLLSRFVRDDARLCFDKMKEAFSGFEHLMVVGVSEWLMKRTQQSPMFSHAQFCFIHNGINTALFTRCETTALRDSLGIEADRKVVLHVTPNFWHPIKGGAYVLDLARRLPEYQFIIVGFHGDAERMPSNVITVSHTQNQAELAAYYSMADCFVCTSLRESYPTVCLEAVSCGCNVVAFETGGAPETIPSGMGETVPCYDMDRFARAVTRWANAKADPLVVAQARERITRAGMLEQYRQVYRSCL